MESLRNSDLRDFSLDYPDLKKGSLVYLMFNLEASLRYVIVFDSFVRAKSENCVLAKEALYLPSYRDFFCGKPVPTILKEVRTFFPSSVDDYCTANSDIDPLGQLAVARKLFSEGFCVESSFIQSLDYLEYIAKLGY